MKKNVHINLGLQAIVVVITITVVICATQFDRQLVILSFLMGLLGGITGCFVNLLVLRDVINEAAKAQKGIKNEVEDSYSDFPLFNEEPFKNMARDDNPIVDPKDYPPED